MAGTSLLALLDDIVSVLDDVAVMTKVAAKKTAGVLGDDLALNAQQVAGIRAERELPVVWAVAKGSLRNKVILVPLALGISALAPWLVAPLLMIGGAYLCFEGFEKIFHHARRTPAEQADVLQALADPEVDLVALERDKIQGAIRTDFVLSAEIIVIALGTVAGAALHTRIVVVSIIAILMTVGVYGFVAALVKLDDVGLLLTRTPGTQSRRVGQLLVGAAPRLMRTLSVVGTVAMFLVGGGILLHGITHDLAAHIAPWAGPWASPLEQGASLLMGLLAGAILAGGVGLIKWIWRRRTQHQSGPLEH